MNFLLTLLAEAASSTDTGTGAVVYGLAAALVTAVGGAAFQFYKFRKQAQREDDSLIAAATGEAVAAAKEMLQEYRLELKRAREEMNELRARLETANQRIARLELELESATAQREKLMSELNDAFERRGVDSEKYREMQRRVEELEALMRGRNDTRVSDAAREGGHEGARQGAREGVHEVEASRTTPQQEEPHA